MNIESSLHADSDWRAALAGEFASDYLRRLDAHLAREAAAGKAIFPAPELRLHALNMTPLARLCVVLIGQDPYPSPGHAHGLSFSVRPEVKPLPKSLLNIFRELKEDLGVDNSNGSLEAWARQGVLLLNAVLSVEQGRAGSHAKLGWEQFTDRIIAVVNARPEPVVFLLWGAYAQKKGKVIDRDRHAVIESPHPSPLSAYRGFFGSRPFSRVNAHLQAFGRKPIDWRT